MNAIDTENTENVIPDFKDIFSDFEKNLQLSLKTWYNHHQENTKHYTAAYQHLCTNPIFNELANKLKLLEQRNTELINTNKLLESKLEQANKLNADGNIQDNHNLTLSINELSSPNNNSEDLQQLNNVVKKLEKMSLETEHNRVHSKSILVLIMQMMKLKKLKLKVKRLRLRLRRKMKM